MNFNIFKKHETETTQIEPTAEPEEKTFICDKCSLETDKTEQTETEEGFKLCFGCDSLRNSCINEPTEARSLKDFIKEVNDNKKRQDPTAEPTTAKKKDYKHIPVRKNTFFKFREMKGNVSSDDFFLNEIMKQYEGEK